MQLTQKIIGEPVINIALQLVGDFMAVNCCFKSVRSRIFAGLNLCDFASSEQFSCLFYS